MEIIKWFWPLLKLFQEHMLGRRLHLHKFFFDIEVIRFSFKCLSKCFNCLACKRDSNVVYEEKKYSKGIGTMPTNSKASNSWANAFKDFLEGIFKKYSTAGLLCLQCMWNNLQYFKCQTILQNGNSIASHSILIDFTSL